MKRRTFLSSPFRSFCSADLVVGNSNTFPPSSPARASNQATTARHPLPSSANSNARITRSTTNQLGLYPFTYFFQPPDENLPIIVALKNHSTLVTTRHDVVTNTRIVKSK